jgi:hypothetical protein
MTESIQPNNREELRNMSADALRELLARSIAKSAEEQEAQKALVVRMRQDARLFAEQMHAAGARTDVVTSTIKVEKGGFFGGAENRKVEYRAWFIRKDTNYGGDSMNEEDHTSYAHQDMTDYFTRRIAILESGELVVCHSVDNPNGPYVTFDYYPESPGADGDFVSNKISESPDLFQLAYMEWLNDLSAATEHYTGIEK